MRKAVAIGVPRLQLRQRLRLWRNEGRLIVARHRRKTTRRNNVVVVVDATVRRLLPRPSTAEINGSGNDPLRDTVAPIPFLRTILDNGPNGIGRNPDVGPIPPRRRIAVGVGRVNPTAIATPVRLPPNTAIGSIANITVIATRSRRLRRTNPDTATSGAEAVITNRKRNPSPPPKSANTSTGGITRTTTRVMMTRLVCPSLENTDSSNPPICTK